MVRKTNSFSNIANMQVVPVLKSKKFPSLVNVLHSQLRLYLIIWQSYLHIINKLPTGTMFGNLQYHQTSATHKITPLRQKRSGKLGRLFKFSLARAQKLVTKRSHKKCFSCYCIFYRERERGVFRAIANVLILDKI